MSNRHEGLLAQIERDVLDSSRSLSDVLRMCIVLGGKSGSAQLRDWASRELNGYEEAPSDELPDYRIVAAPLQLDAMVGSNQITGQTISPGQLPSVAQDVIKEEVRLAGSVAELESMAKQASKSGVKLMPQGATALVGIMNHQNDRPFQHITDLYWTVSHHAIAGVLDRIRAKLAALTAEMRAITPGDDDLPTAAAADQAVQVVVHGNERGVVNVNTASGSAANITHSETSSPDMESSFWSRWRIAGAAIVGLATIAGAIFAWAQLQGW